MDNNDIEIRYRCIWCQCIMDEHLTCINKEEQDKYEGVRLPSAYCKECYEIIMKENDF